MRCNDKRGLARVPGKDVPTRYQRCRSQAAHLISMMLMVVVVMMMVMMVMVVMMNMSACSGQISPSFLGRRRARSVAFCWAARVLRGGPTRTRTSATALCVRPANQDAPARGTVQLKIKW